MGCGNSTDRISYLDQGDYLHQGDVIFSASGLYYLWVDYDGRFHIYQTKKQFDYSDDNSIWKWQNTEEELPTENGPYKLVLQQNENLVVQNVKNENVWDNDAEEKNPTGPYYLWIEDNGDLQVYDKDDYCVWSKDFFIQYVPQETALYTADVMFSESGEYYLWIGDNGKFFIYRTSVPYNTEDENSHEIWKNTDRESDKGQYYLLLGKDQNLGLYNTQDQEEWTNNQQTQYTSGPYYLWLGDDGKLGVYNRDDVELWASQ